MTGVTRVTGEERVRAKRVKGVTGEERASNGEEGRFVDLTLLHTTLLSIAAHPACAC